MQIKIQTNFPQVAAALRGMGAVAAGLVLVTALKLLSTLRGNRLAALEGNVLPGQTAGRGL